MGVLLQGFYKLGPNRAVPSPADGDPKTPWWWDHLAAQGRALSLAGFTAVWLPPVPKTASGCPAEPVTIWRTLLPGKSSAASPWR